MEVMTTSFISGVVIFLVRGVMFRHIKDTIKRRKIKANTLHELDIISLQVTRIKAKYKELREIDGSINNPKITTSLNIMGEQIEQATKRLDQMYDAAASNEYSRLSVLNVSFSSCFDNIVNENNAITDILENYLISNN